MTDTVAPTGVTVALVTPLDERGGLDEAALERIVARAVARGATGLSPCGSTGEGARLSRPERLSVLRAVRRLAPDEMPVIPAVPVGAVADAITELAEVAEAGASAALVAPPAYHPSDSEDLERLYLALADASAVPLVLYNIPAMTKSSIPPAVVRELAGHPRIAGMKDSSRDLEYLESVLYGTRAQDFSVLTGSDTMLVASLLLGARGTIAASANLVPELSVGICGSMRDGNLEKALELQRQLFLIVKACRRGNTPAGWKAALEWAGLCSARLAAPAGRLPDDETRELTADLALLLPEVVR
jgi:dihydrodipicolinate synthase/N-acetylneuraminate lyase